MYKAVFYFFFLFPSMTDYEKLYEEVKQLNDPQAMKFFYAMRNMERQNALLDEQNKEIERMIEHVKVENAILESAFKENINKEEKPQWIKNLLKK